MGSQSRESLGQDSHVTEPPSSWSHSSHGSEAKCFAEAGKMEPNQLLDGFGPLQPAVAVH